MAERAEFTLNGDFHECFCSNQTLCWHEASPRYVPNAPLPLRRQLLSHDQGVQTIGIVSGCGPLHEIIFAFVKQDGGGVIYGGLQFHGGSSHLAKTVLRSL